MVKGLTASDILMIVRAALGTKGKEIIIQHDNGYGIVLEVDGDVITIFTITQHFFGMKESLFMDFIFDFFKEVSPFQTEKTVLEYMKGADEMVEGN